MRINEPYFITQDKKGKKNSPSVVLVVIIKLIIDVNWSFHVLVHLHITYVYNNDEKAGG